MEARSQPFAPNTGNISASLRKRMKQLQKTKIRHDAITTDVSQALELQQRLFRQYEGQSLEDLFPGCVISNISGEAYEIQGSDSLLLHKPDPEKTVSILSRILPTLFGIRTKTAQKLTNQGYHTLQDLTRHPRWKKSASEILAMIENRDTIGLINHYGRRFGQSHAILLAIVGTFYPKESIRIIDVETLGFQPSPLFLVGIATPNSQGLETRQLLARNLEEEPAVLEECVKELSAAKAIISFNGRSFDVPYLQGRVGYYGLSQPSIKAHIDLLHFSRRYWRKQISNCKLGTLEKEILRINRNEDLPSALVPRFYRRYLNTQNPGPLVPIINHNRTDLSSLVAIFNRLCDSLKDL